MSDLPDVFTPPPSSPSARSKEDKVGLQDIIKSPPAKRPSQPEMPPDAIMKLSQEATASSKPDQSKLQPAAINPQQAGYPAGKPRYDNIKAKLTK